VASSGLEFRLLGPLEVRNDGVPVPLGGQKQRALLALLLLHVSRVVASERLIQELWGEQPPRTAPTALQNLVGQLRKLLPPDVLATRAPGYVLDVAAEQVDVAHFERLLRAARAQEPAQRVRTLGEALELWRGPPLAEFTYESFATAEIARLEELRLEVLESRIDAELELGHGAQVVAELEGLVAESPLRERLRGQLMLALYRSGRQADALQAYHDARRMLVDELGIEPSPALSQLYRSILRQEGELEQTSPARNIDDHFGDVVKALLAGRLVIVLGSGVSLADELREGSLPGLGDVAAHLARVFDYPSDHRRDLPRVAEYVALSKGAGPLYDELHALFDQDCAPGPAHRAVAQLAALLRSRDAPRPLLVATNFDQLLEQAFRDVGEELDVVLYLALGRHRGKFLHLKANGQSTVVEVPNAYTDLSLDHTAVLFKIHGGVDLGPEREWESFVVSEDDYIDYLAQADISVVLPVTLAAKLRRSHFLFLGYPVDEWSLRVFLHRLFGREKVAYRSWAVVPRADQIEQELWRQRGIDIFSVSLDDYLTQLRARVEAEVGG
jgi:DNA-binding SARP family transcriptional activator